MTIVSDPRVKPVFENYPVLVKEKMEDLRNLIIETAREMPEVASLEETLKWGEPSYLTKHGSTLRIDWKSKSPDHYAMYFKCTSRLVETFKLVFDQKFRFEGNRAIVFQLDEVVPETELKECIRATLRYHKVKDRRELGIFDNHG